MRALHINAYARNRQNDQPAPAEGSALHAVMQRMQALGIRAEGDASQGAMAELDRIAHDSDDPDHGAAWACRQCWVWPQTLRILRVWQMLSGQWRMGMDGIATFDAAGARAILLDVVPSARQRRRWWPLLLAAADETSRQSRIDRERAQHEQPT